MAKILITGSSDGIGQAGAKLLADQGHKVFLHARNQERAKQAKDAVPKAEGVVIGDLSTVAGAKDTATEANKVGPFDSIVHNAGLGPSNADRKTADGLQSTFAVNSLAPYILTCLMDKPKRLLYLSSQLHSGGDDSLKDVGYQHKQFQSMQAYSDSKLHDIMLAKAVSRRWTDVQSCSLDPGWIATKMGGAGAPGKTSTPAKAMVDFAIGQSDITGDQTGVYFNPQGVRTPHKGATDERKQDEFMKICEQLSGLSLPK
ncbi:uncharacterized protein LTR77_000193 [Saxophila tyrrhenica]|uniref:Uncharacterized protein n=1 Tax=Saxophila tyrrhenica TaxID=1690608 RepID=A0AAV9PMW4_9PEZI|nr:hypothetical protein LTR77_000193 [Saxophila tyrrhenica]